MWLDSRVNEHRANPTGVGGERLDGVNLALGRKNRAVQFVDHVSLPIDEGMSPLTQVFRKRLVGQGGEIPRAQGEDFGDVRRSRADSG